MEKHRHLTIEEKRDWLAGIFRDESGDFSQADKFKALAEDTRLAQLQEEKEQAAQAAENRTLKNVPNLLSELLPSP
ncbi:MAG: hypothetical protein Q4F40_09260 [Akkermansia sp.]|nr:hypothetical protein [Akkermansia sp.]MDO5465111.1 hypothetical protein [Akkermansia sp.]